MRNYGFLQLAALAIASACLDVTRAGPGIASPTQLHQMTAWPTAAIMLSCGRTPTTAIPTQTLWLPTGANTVDSVRLRLQGVGDVRTCTRSDSGFGMSYHTPDLVDVVASDSESVHITLGSTVAGRTTVAVRVN